MVLKQKLHNLFYNLKRKIKKYFLNFEIKNNFFKKMKKFKITINLSQKSEKIQKYNEIFTQKYHKKYSIHSL